MTGAHSESLNILQRSDEGDNVKALFEKKKERKK